MANDFRRVSPGMYQGPNGQIVRSQQRPQQRPAPSGTRGEIGPIGGYPPGMQRPQPMGPQRPSVGGWRSGPNMPIDQTYQDQQQGPSIGGFEQQQQQPYFGPPPRNFGDSFQGGQAGGWQQPPMPQGMPPQGMPPQPMGPPPPQGQMPQPNRGAEMMRRSPLIGKIQGAKGPAGILTQPPKGNFY
jgi:hypothetical protein